MAEPTHIFVYGLLTFPDIVTAITGKDIEALPAVLPGYRRYGLSKSPLETPVPILLEETGYRQSGQLLMNVDATSVAKLDFFEDLDSGHYVKTPVRVEANGQWYPALCYSAGPALAPYAAGDWQPAMVSAAAKADLIHRLIPQMFVGMTDPAP
ncbi:MAG: gamma-glutamylcyclotransferase family protein [Rheinheimera sp.]